jgi:outer membrane protein assembly factor BamE (lipoprotein component of BamABCDE complex)
MISRIIIIVLLGAFVISGCASVADRAQRIRSQYPQWDEATVQKVAAKQVEIGMTPEMVTAALGKPDAIPRQGDEEKWCFALLLGGFSGPAYKEFVYFVYFKNGHVVRMEGDRRRLP